MNTTLTARTSNIYRIHRMAQVMKETCFGTSLPNKSFKNKQYFYGRASTTCFFNSLVNQQQDAYCSNNYSYFLLDPWRHSYKSKLWNLWADLKRWYLDYLGCNYRGHAGQSEQSASVSPSQPGNMQGRPCLTNLISFSSKVSHLADEGKGVDVIYLPFRKAFDTCAPQHSLGRNYLHMALMGQEFTG